MKIVWALYLRSAIGLGSDYGRIIEALIEPFMFFFIWGMLYQSGIIDPQLAQQFFVVNLVWASSGALQKQATLSIMYDFWSKEFVELFRAGVSASTYLIAMGLFGGSVGLASVLLYLILAPILFGIESEAIARLIWALPVYTMSALAMSCIGVGVVLRFSQLYGFVPGVLLQLSVVASSPFVPPKDLPILWEKISVFFPFTLTFEFARSGDPSDLWYGGCVASVWFLASIAFYFLMFRHALREGKLARA
jgi:hypothetical protein